MTLIEVMSITSNDISTIHRLAKRLKEDIVRRELQIGDRYLNAHEAADMLGVSRATAQRAMKVLGDTQTLLRRPKLGTFVGPGAVSQAKSKTRTPPLVRTLQVLGGIPKESEHWAFPLVEVVQSLHDFMPAFNAQSYNLPNEKPEKYVREIIKRGINDGSLAGIVMLSCVREVQEMVLESRVPAVNLGSVYASTSSLPRIDVDHFEVGRLSARHLLERGHRRIELLMRETWRPGDNRMLEGINQAMAEAGMSFGALVTRSCPQEKPFIAKEIRRLLELEDHPTALICRGWGAAETAVEVLNSKSLRAPQDLDIVCNVSALGNTEHCNFSLVCPRQTYREIAGQIAQMLDRVVKGENLENQRVVIPVELAGPEQQKMRGT